jgi:tungstate transport system ATP-binding protein
VVSAQSILPLQLDEIQIWRNGKRLLGPLSWVLQGRGLTILMGPNGSGKTTFLRAMHGIERISKGQLRWSADAQKVQQAQAFVFQAPIMMRRSVRDCIAYPLRLRGVSRAQARDAADGWAARVGLGAAVTRPAMVLSGGEKQKLALARALVTAPQLLFLDEPCANLDGRATHDIEAILKEACMAGTRVVMSTHDIGQARRLADDVLFLHDGRLIEAAPKDQFFTRPATPEGASFLKGDLLL